MSRTSEGVEQATKENYYLGGRTSVSVDISEATLRAGLRFPCLSVSLQARSIVNPQERKVTWDRPITVIVYREQTVSSPNSAV
jgi:hypothetical protein